MEYENPDYLIEAEELMSRLTDTNLRIFDTSVFLRASKNGYKAESGLEQYQKHHIPNAGFIDLIKDWSSENSPLNFTLPTIEQLNMAIGSSGINNTHEVILYSSGHLMWATRAWWLLKFSGHQNVRILNGNLSVWSQKKFPLEPGLSQYATERFKGEPNWNLFSTTRDIEDSEESGSCVINALSKALYEGTGDFYYSRRGHIPGSRSVFYGDILNGEFFKTADNLTETLEEKGLTEASEVIVYCGGGIAATIDAFACKLLGHERVSVYDGSMSEWVESDDRPLKIGEEP